MVCPDCREKMILAVNDALGQEWACPVCRQTIEVNFDAKSKG